MTLGFADHASIQLAPAHLPVVRRAEKIIKVRKQWTSDRTEGLQGCFEVTDWTTLIAPSSNINEQADTATSYISFCVDYIIPTKTITIFPNNKPWVTKELKVLLNMKNILFFVVLTHSIFCGSDKVKKKNQQIGEVGHKSC